MTDDERPPARPRTDDERPPARPRTRLAVVLIYLGGVLVLVAILLLVIHPEWF